MRWQVNRASSDINFEITMTRTRSGMLLWMLTGLMLRLRADKGCGVGERIGKIRLLINHATEWPACIEA